MGEYSCRRRKCGSFSTRAAGLPNWAEPQPDPENDPSLSCLDLGERSAISLALLVNADRLLIDEWAGRAEAQRLKLKVTGTLGSLAEAHLQGLLDFEEAVARLRRTNFYASDSLVEHIRRKLLDKD